MVADSRVVTTRMDGTVRVISVDNPPVSALGHAVRAGLAEALDAASEQDAAIVIACNGRSFFAGADITEFGKPPREPALRQLVERIESHPKPVVAAIHGTALGRRMGCEGVAAGQPTGDLP